MLQNIHVKNLALIDEADVDFTKGLNILSGETGAGKSIIIGSINLALGEKVPKGFVRESADFGLVELVFFVEKESQIKFLNSIDVFPSDQQIILSRKITNGRSISKINGETVPVNKLKEVASVLLDIHGQHDHQSLFHKKYHLEFVDEFAKKTILPLKKEFSELFHKYMETLKEYKSLDKNEEERVREISYLEYELLEIQNAKLLPNEDVELELEFRKMMNGKKIADAVTIAHTYTGYDSMESAGELIGRALKELAPVITYDSHLESLNGMLKEIDSLLNDFNREISEYADSITFSDGELAEAEERLNIWNKLKAKYGSSYEAIMKYYDEKENMLAVLKNYESVIEEKRMQIQNLEKQMVEKAQVLTSLRLEAADKLSKAIVESLNDLNFLDVNFRIDRRESTHFSSLGKDEMEFMISTNVGEKVKPLAQVASGGELSRIMLGIKTVMAKNDEIDTLIFDEIDSGISGRTAQKVSEKLAVLGKTHQVICITHLAQIAAMSDSHYKIEKSVSNNSTITQIQKLNHQESVEELARIIGGAQITDTVISSAIEMKNLAKTVKQSK